MANQGGGSSVWLWVGLGCGGLVLVLACVGGAGFWFYYQARDAQDQVAVAFEQARAQEEAQRRMAEQAQPGMPGVPLPAVPTGPGPTDRTPRMIVATVTSVTGNPGVAPGNVCSFAVEHHEQPARPEGYWCRAHVMCGLTLIYGGGEAGYFPCTLTDSPRGVTGADGDTTATDRDGSLELDTRSGRLVVRDDASGHLGAFSVEGTINSVR
jgi:hypothetical protein